MAGKKDHLLKAEPLRMTLITGNHEVVGTVTHPGGRRAEDRERAI